MSYVTQADAEGVMGAEAFRLLYQVQGRLDEAAITRNAHMASKLVDLGIMGHYSGPFPLRTSPIADLARIAALEFFLWYSLRRKPERAASAIEHKKAGNEFLEQLRSALLQLGDDNASETVGAFAPPANNGHAGLYPPGCGLGDLLHRPAPDAPARYRVAFRGGAPARPLKESLAYGIRRYARCPVVRR